MNIDPTIDAGPGGFERPPLPSPPASVASGTAAGSLLPAQRSRPIPAGSSKESNLIAYVDRMVMSINRRHAKKFSAAFSQDFEVVRECGPEENSEASEGAGYEGFEEVARDIERLVDVLWVSGTPSLQLPYLIALACLINNYLPDYPFRPAIAFPLLIKLDYVFASVLTGNNIKTGAPVSGCDSMASVASMTEKVRIKSIAESTRVTVVELQGNMPSDVDVEAEMSSVYGDSDGFGDVDSMDTDTETVTDQTSDGGRTQICGGGGKLGRWAMASARVYEQTLNFLGDELGL